MDPYEKLANAIVLLAAKDYRSALKRLKKYPSDREAKAAVLELERFFRSGWYSVLTSVDGEYLIENLRKEVLE
jgi:hypothetical protein